MNQEVLSKLTVSIFIEHEDRILMVQEAKPKYKGLWSQPGGHLHHHETPEEAAIREAYEETGYHVRILSGFVTYVSPGETPDEAYFMNFCFHAALKRRARGEFDPTEIMSTRWFELREFKALNQSLYRSELTVFRTADWLRHRFRPRGIIKIPPRGKRHATFAS